MLIRVLLAIDPSGLERVRRVIGGENILTEEASGGSALWESLSNRSFDMLIASREALPRPAGDTIEAVTALPGHPDVVVLVRTETAETQTRLLGAGASAVLHADSSDDALADALAALIARRRDEAVLRTRSAAAPVSTTFSTYHSDNSAMRQLLDIARRVAASDSSVLILGETGTGKEWLARGLHASSARADGPFIAVNCGAIPETLIESELFGHEEGAFTGAKRAHRGYFEMAHSGTIFLDEIAEMPPHVQVRLLRVVQERSFQRVGSERPIDVDIRIVAATNRDPAEEIAAKRLRSDLYYRLGVVTLSIPALRERPEDIENLTRSFVTVYAERMGRSIAGISRRAMDVLVRYGWPGNVRELQNVVERFVLLADSPEIDVGDLPDELVTGVHETEVRARPESGADAHPGRSLPEARREVLDTFEREYLEAILRACRGRVGEAARRSGISPRSLYAKMRRHGLEKERYRRPDQGAADTSAT